MGARLAPGSGVGELWREVHIFYAGAGDRNPARHGLGVHRQSRRRGRRGAGGEAMSAAGLSSIMEPPSWDVA